MYANNAGAGNVAPPNQQFYFIKQVIPDGGMFAMDIEIAENAPLNVAHGATSKSDLVTSPKESLDKKECKAKGSSTENPLESASTQSALKDQLEFRRDGIDNPVEQSSIHSEAAPRYPK